MTSQCKYRASLDFRAIKLHSRGRWHWILKQAGIAPELLTGRHSACPICGGKDRFRFDNKNGDGTFICNRCGAGDGFTLLQRYLCWGAFDTFCGVSSVLSGGGLDVEQRAVQAASDTNVIDLDTRQSRWLRRNILKAWEEAQPIAELDAAHKYLTMSRGFMLSTFPDALRYHPALYYDKERRFPGMVAKFSDINGDTITLQRLFLDSDGNKAPLPKKELKKFMSIPKRGATSGGAVQLFKPSHQLGLAEGIETALACNLLFEIPVWATCTAGLLERVQVPENCEIFIFADNDKSKAGERAANILADRLHKEGKRVRKPLVPPVEGRDWADVYYLNRSKNQNVC